MKDNVQLEANYPHPPSRVWKALTDPAALGRWLMPTDFKPMIGFRFRLDRPGKSPIECQVIEAEEGKRLAYTWWDDEEGQPSLVAWTLEPKDGGTQLRLEHSVMAQPVVTCLAVDRYFNWQYALKHSLPGLLCLLQHLDSHPVPVVYVQEELVTV